VIGLLDLLRIVANCTRNVALCCAAMSLLRSVAICIGFVASHFICAMLSRTCFATPFIGEGQNPQSVINGQRSNQKVPSAKGSFEPKWDNRYWTGVVESQEDNLLR
jgi:hypothetical protein